MSQAASAGFYGAPSPHCLQFYAKYSLQFLPGYKNLKKSYQYPQFSLILLKFLRDNKRATQLAKLVSQCVKTWGVDMELKRQQELQRDVDNVFLTGLIDDKEKIFFQLTEFSQRVRKLKILKTVNEREKFINALRDLVDGEDEEGEEVA